ncbi:MAG: FAD-dependent oxidoreductase [Acidobacteria bacterium]|nr:FAD-dependent oxidoreductase [Acidobacteriota bacterium]
MSVRTRPAVSEPGHRSAATGFDAIVIGGGFAGLSSAVALVEQGARVLVLEARPALGGRASAVRDPATGEKLDNGQHVLMGCYDATLSFLRRIGAADRVRWQAGLSLTMVGRDGHGSVLQLPPLAAPLHLMAGVLAWDALSWSEKASVLRVGAALRTGRDAGTEVPALHGGTERTGTERRDFSPGVEDFSPGVAAPVRSAGTSVPASPTSVPASPTSGRTVRQWLEQQGQAPRLIELFWEPLALAALNQPIDEAAVDTFLEVLSRMLGPEADRAALVVPAVPLDELYAEPARAWLEARGSEVRTRSAATIVVEDQRVRGVTVRGERIDAPIVVAGVPWFALPSLFNPPPAALAGLLGRARGTAGSPIVTVNLWYDRSVLDDMLIGLPGRVFQWAFDKARIFGRARSHLSMVSSGAAGVVLKARDELVAIARRELEEAVPRAAGATMVGATAVRERLATFSLAPGQPARPGTRTAVVGLLLAGDWVDTGLPATIEGAVVSGQWAAEAARTG